MTRFARTLHLGASMDFTTTYSVPQLRPFHDGDGAKSDVNPWLRVQKGETALALTTPLLPTPPAWGERMGMLPRNITD